MFARWGKFTYRHRKIVPLIIVALIALLYGVFGTQLASRMSQEGWDDPNSSSTQAAKIEQEIFGRDSSGDVILLFQGPTNVVEGTTGQDIAAYLETLQADYPEQIKEIVSYFSTPNAALISEDTTTTFAAIALAGDGEQTLKDFRIIQDDLNPEIADVTVEVAGATAVADALDSGMADDISRAELYGLPAVAILLLLVFGTVVAAFMPLIVGVMSILGSLGILAILAETTQVNVFAQSVVTLLGLGLAIDYGLFMVSRFREELDKGADVETAVITTTNNAGKTVVFSAGMVAVALSGLFVFPQAFLKSVAYGAISAVGLAALLSITMLPAIFGLLGKRIDALPVRKTSRRAKPLKSTFWYRIPKWAMSKAGLVTTGIIVLLLAMTAPLANVKFGGLNETYLPPNNEVRTAQATFDELFPEFRTEPIKLVVTNADNSQLVEIYQQAAEVQGLTDRLSPSTATVDGTTVLSAGIQNRELYDDVVQQLRAIEAPEGVELYIGGTPALEVESMEALFDRLPWMALYIIVATFILMALVFGSVIIPAKAVIMTILGMGATLGVLTLMFVDGFGADLFNFTAGPLMSPILVLILAILYGLSTDYEVFLVSRMVEARERGESTDEAICSGTARTGSIITAAALIMIVVSAAFGFSDIVMMKTIAFGMVVALFLDATIIRMLLVPAVMHLLREDNWWAPGFVRKAADALGHNKSEPVEVTPRAVPPAALAGDSEEEEREGELDDAHEAEHKADAELVPAGVATAEFEQVASQPAHAAPVEATPATAAWDADAPATAAWTTDAEAETDTVAEAEVADETATEPADAPAHSHRSHTATSAPVQEDSLENAGEEIATAEDSTPAAGSSLADAERAPQTAIRGGVPADTAEHLIPFPELEKLLKERAKQSKHRRK